MNEPVKVLYFVDRMRRGGIQSLVIDWASRFDKTKIHVDVLVLDDGQTYELEDTLKELGCNIYKLKGVWINQPLDFLKEAKALNNFFKEHHDYKVVHMHSSSKNYMVLKYAKKYGIPVRIAHSHNTDFQTEVIYKKMVGNMLKNRLIKYATDYFACSSLAGRFLFGSNIDSNPKFRIIHNAIDYDKFKFDEETREIVRKEFNIKDDEIVIGHIGRFEYQKNHEFLIDVFKELVNINKNYKLLLVGIGSLEDSIKNKVISLNLQDNVIFAGYRDDVYRMVQAMDIFAFPSRYEGLGLGLVEVQASGCPCIATKKVIPEEVKINDNFNFIDLNISKWVDTIINIDRTRVDSKDNFRKAGYFIEDVIEELTNIYIG